MIFCNQTGTDLLSSWLDPGIKQGRGFYSGKGGGVLSISSSSSAHQRRSPVHEFVSEALLSSLWSPIPSPKNVKGVFQKTNGCYSRRLFFGGGGVMKEIEGGVKESY